MRKTNTLLFLASGLMIFLLFTTAFVQAQETPQWFPEEGTQIDYAVTSYLTMLNGTESTETYFDVYAFAGSITLRPLHLRDLTGEGDFSSLYSIVNNTEVIFSSRYAVENSTHYSRTVKLVWDGGESNASLNTIYLVTAEYSGGYIHPWFYPSEEYIQRNHFQESSEDIVDYVNNELATGEDCGVDDGFHDDMMLVAKTSESLIAHNSYGSSYTFNFTYVFDLSGKTKSVTLATRHSIYSSYGLFTSSYRFDVVTGGVKGFFENLPWIWILGGVAAVELIVIVIISVVKKRK